MELLSGKTLTQLSFDEALSATQVVQILLPIVEALAVAHANGVVHRDLKPDNIFVVDEAGRAQPKLLDFGIAKSTDGSARGLTQSGALLGTPEYMAPEAARGTANLDGRADIWSLCVVLYERVAGELPFDGDNLHAVLCSIIEHSPKPLPAHVPGSAGLWKVLQRGLAKEPGDRFQSMAELGRELAAWLKSQRVYTDASGLSLEAKWRLSAPPGATSPRASHEKPNLWLIMTALLALGLGGAWSRASGKTQGAAAQAAPTAAVAGAAGVMPPATQPPVPIEPQAATPAAPTPAVRRSPTRPVQRSAARTIAEASAEHVSATRVASSDLIAPY